MLLLKCSVALLQVLLGILSAGVIFLSLVPFITSSSSKILLLLTHLFLTAALSHSAQLCRIIAGSGSSSGRARVCVC